jgi:hypothetical protein
MGSRLVSGLDFKDGAARQRTLERATDSGQMATSPSFTLLSGTGDQSGFFVVLPVYRAGAPYGTVTDRRNSLIGFVHAGFQTDILFASIIEAATKAGGLDLYFFADNDNRDQSARSISTGPACARSQPTSVARSAIVGPHWSGKLRVGDADWTLIGTSPRRTSSPKPCRRLVRTHMRTPAQRCIDGLHLGKCSARPTPPRHKCET